MARTGEEEEGDIVMGVAKATGRATHMAAVQIILEEKMTEIKCQSKKKVQSAWQPRDAIVTRPGTRAVAHTQGTSSRVKGPKFIQHGEQRLPYGASVII